MADEKDWGASAQDAFAASSGEAQDLFMDFGGMTGKDVDQGLEKVDKEGYYHLEVLSVKPDFRVKDKGEDVTPHLLVDLLVGETVPGQSAAGAHLFWRLYVAPKGGGPATDYIRESLARLGVATGILWMPDGEDGPVCLTGTRDTKFSINVFQQAVGKQIIGHVKREAGDDNLKKPGTKYPDKYTFPYNKGFGPVDDPKYANVPKNREWLKAIGKEACMPAAGSAASPAKTPTNGAAGGTANKTPAAGKPPFDDSDL